MSAATATAARKHVVIVDANANGVDALAIARARGYEVTFVRSAQLAGYADAGALDRAAAQADRVVAMANSADPRALLDAMRRLHAVHPIDAFVCPWELPVAATASVAARLAVPFTSAGAVDCCRNKPMARELLRQGAVPSAAFATAMNPDEALAAAARIGFPLVLKPASGTGSMMASVCRDAASLREALAQYWRTLDAEPPAMQHLLAGPLLLEEWLDGHMVSAELVADSAGLRVLTITDRQRGRDNEILELGSMMPADLEPAQRDAVAAYALTAAQALGLDLGIFHLEIMLTARGPRLVEANPRVMGGSARALIRSTFGIEILETLFDIHVDARAPVDLGRQRCWSASHIIGGRHAQVLARDFAPQLLLPYGDAIVAFAFAPRAGAPVPQYRNNYDAVGAFTVRADSAAAARALRDAILALVEDATGLVLVR